MLPTLVSRLASGHLCVCLVTHRVSSTAGNCLIFQHSSPSHQWLNCPIKELCFTLLNVPTPPRALNHTRPVRQRLHSAVTSRPVRRPGARCSSVVRAFAHGAMGRRIDPSWGGPIGLFIVPASAPLLV